MIWDRLPGYLGNRRDTGPVIYVRYSTPFPAVVQEAASPSFS